MSKNAIVTKASMIQMLADANEAKTIQIIGRALWAIFEFQTRDEQTTNSTRLWNDVGFSSADARSGSLTAKYWKKHGTLLDWQVGRWTRNFRGAPRITKYHRQLNEIALAKAAMKEAA